MRAFGEIVMTTPGILLRLGMLLLGYWELYLAILVIRRRRRAPVIAVGVGQLLLWIFAFVLMLDGSFDGKLGNRSAWPEISLWAYRLPWGLWVSFLVLGVLLCALESWEHWRYGRSHLGPNSHQGGGGPAARRGLLRQGGGAARPDQSVDDPALPGADRPGSDRLRGLLALPLPEGGRRRTAAGC